MRPAQTHSHSLARGYKMFFMLSLAEHEIFSANIWKCQQ